MGNAKRKPKVKQDRKMPKTSEAPRPVGEINPYHAIFPTRDSERELEWTVVEPRTRRARGVKVNEHAQQIKDRVAAWKADCDEMRDNCRGARVKGKANTSGNGEGGEKETSRYVRSLQMGRISIERDSKNERKQNKSKLKIDDRSSEEDEVKSNQALMGEDWKAEASGYKAMRSRKKDRADKTWRVKIEPKRENSNEKSEVTSSTYVESEAADRMYRRAMRQFIKDNESMARRRPEQGEAQDTGDGAKIEQEIAMMEPALAEDRMNELNEEGGKEQKEVNHPGQWIEKRSSNEIVIDLPTLLMNQGYIDRRPKSMVKVNGVECQALWDIGSTITLVSKNLFDRLKGEMLYEYSAPEVRFNTPFGWGMKAERCYWIILDIEGYQCQRPVYVMDLPGERCVIGVDTIFDENVSVDKTSIRIKGRNQALARAEACRIPAKSVSACRFCLATQGLDGIKFAVSTAHVTTEAEVASTHVRIVDSKWCEILVYNRGEQEIQLRPTFLVELEPVSNTRRLSRSPETTLRDNDGKFE